MGYIEKSKGYRFYCHSRGTKIAELVNTKFFENGDNNGNSRVRNLVFEEESQTISVHIILEMTKDLLFLTTD